MSNDFNILTLGCGSAKPTLRHQPSSTVVDYRGNLFMVDCGEGAQISMQRFRLNPGRLRHIFLTHLHGDHVLGLPGLIGSMALSGQGGDLTIHTFADGKQILAEILDYFSRDMPMKVEFNVIRPEEAVVYESDSLRVRTVALRHRLPDVGYIFEEKPKLRHIIREACEYHQVPVAILKDIKRGADFIRPDGTVVANTLLTSEADPQRSYAHISDTSFMPEIAEKIGPVDLLFHETTYLDEHEKEAAARGHSTARQAAEMARLCGAKRLLTGHYSSRYRDDSLFQKQAQEVFDDVILNKEGLRTPV